MTIDPGAPGDPEVCCAADKWVAACLEATRHLNTPAAAAWVRANPPTPEAIARLAWISRSAGQSEIASAPRKAVEWSARRLRDHRDDYVARTGSKRGWIDQACEITGLSERSVRSRLKE